MKSSSMMYLDECSMSNLTSASNEASAASLSSSSNYKNNEVVGTINTNNMYPPLPQQSFLDSVPTNNNNNSNINSTQSNKKKRNLPGNPDPEAEVIAMSPKTLMATNRFVCEICNKGFQRDQNLQLHRRGHNLPWKLKQRSKQEVVRKKVYICPEPSCVHHEPSRALGDLTGIKKHFSRKHGEKKWKCDKCSKRYAVQSDWKAHSKICGTREYRCDCGTLFSRRDSFITHRAFCGALAGETTIRSFSSSLLLSSPPANHLLPFHNNNLPINFPLIKTEPQQQHFHQHHSQQLNSHIMNTNTVLQQNHQLLPSWFVHNNSHEQNPNSNGHNDNNIHQQLPSPPPHDILSATALLQKAAAKMGATMNNNKSVVASSSTTNPTTTTTANIHVMSQQQEQQQSIQSGSHQHDHMCAPRSLFTAHPHDSCAGPGNLSSSGDHEDQRIFGLSGSTNAFQEAYNGMLCSAKSSSIPAGGAFQEPAFFPCTSTSTETSLNPTIRGSTGGGNELTIDFLGITGYPPPNDQQHFLGMAGLDHLGTTSPYHHDQHHDSNQNQLPAWHG